MRCDHGVYVEVVVGHGGGPYAITVRVGGGDVDDRRNTFDAAMDAGPPWDGWRKGRRLTAANLRLWKLDAVEMSAPEAADVTMQVTDYLRALAHS